jgi:hypothetical protein
MPNKVLASFEHTDRTHCVDVFVRDDGSFGFEEFRGESDGAARWQSLGKYGTLVFASGEAALAAAKAHVAWLPSSEPWRYD